MTHSEQALADQRRAQLNYEINSYPVRVDRNCHRKSSEEKDVLKLEKFNCKLTVPDG